MALASPTKKFFSQTASNLSSIETFLSSVDFPIHTSFTDYLSEDPPILNTSFGPAKTWPLPSPLSPLQFNHAVSLFHHMMQTEASGNRAHGDTLTRLVTEANALFYPQTPHPTSTDPLPLALVPPLFPHAKLGKGTVFSDRNRPRPLAQASRVAGLVRSTALLSLAARAGTLDNQEWGFVVESAIAALYLASIAVDHQQLLVAALVFASLPTLPHLPHTLRGAAAALEGGED
eukprot:gnl/Dysnectes_brevis/7335_a12208_302.p1 GENE.gnl/Dysnectes_brevis/7335_a12208_302~~gnl/Dysnectes_brevis/7335_a12208_302.p1  ORF type:complete len:232 (+),score=57.59 gnl/Dysnectes_brevis/7335_a12208_302:122-817(+)